MLSIHPRFVDGIFAGVKRVELRRRLPRIAADDAVVIYATIPTTAIVGFFTVDSIQRLPLAPLWRRVRKIAGVTRAEYLNYFDGLAEGVGIFIGEVVRFGRPLSLAKLRALWPGFTAPQGFRYLDDKATDLLWSVCSARRIAA